MFSLGRPVPPLALNFDPYNKQWGKMVSEMLSTSVWLGLEYLVPDRQTAGLTQCWAQPQMESVQAAALALNNNTIVPLRRFMEPFPSHELSVLRPKYEAIYLQTSSFNPRKDGLPQKIVQSPLPNDLLSASKLMERKIMFFTSCWKCVGSFAASDILWWRGDKQNPKGA